jgi:hypothetical protein
VEAVADWDGFGHEGGVGGHEREDIGDLVRGSRARCRSHRGGGLEVAQPAEAVGFRRVVGHAGGMQRRQQRPQRSIHET